MRFADLVRAYERIDQTAKRLEIRSILVELLRPLSSEELPEVLFLSQGMLRPEYEGVELGVADSLARRAVATATGSSEEEISRRLRSSGDLGSTVEELLQSQRRLPGSEPLEVTELYQGLERIARSSGVGSQEEKVAILVGLLQKATAVEAKYVVRFVLGKLRLGVREMTILDALAEAFADGGKEARTRIEGAFNVSSDLGLVARALRTEGIDGVSSIRLQVGRPIRPMLAERSPDLADVLKRMEGRAALEYKYDGLRVQAHVSSDGKVTLFSRRLEQISAQFPEIVEELPKALRHFPVIVEGECVPIDPHTDEIRPFQDVSRRRGRKYDLDRMREEVPVSLFLFDLLLAGKVELLDQPFPERRRALTEIVRPGERIGLAKQRVVRDLDQATEFFDESIAAGCEGVMAKSIAAGSTYRAGARGFWWIKYKREYTHGLADSIDGVVVGGFYGRGRRAGGYGALLLAVYNPKLDRFETFCKVGSGFDDAQLMELPKRLHSYETAERPESVSTELTPDRWMRPGLVLEVRGAELSLSPIHRAAVGRIREGAGLALRFPRFTGRFRDDKGPTEATTTDELVRLYESQVRRSPSSRVEGEKS